MRWESRQSIQDTRDNRNDTFDPDHCARVIDESRHYVDRRDDQSRVRDHHASRCDDNEDRGHGHDGNGGTGHLHRVDLDSRADQELQRNRDSEIEPAKLNDFDQRRVQDNDADLHRHH